MPRAVQYIREEGILWLSIGIKLRSQWSEPSTKWPIWKRDSWAQRSSLWYKGKVQCNWRSQLDWSLKIVEYISCMSFYPQKSHADRSTSVGKCSIYFSSVKEKHNTWTSTKAQLVRVNDMMSIALWTRNFLESQRYQVDSLVMYEDSKNAIFVESN